MSTLQTEGADLETRSARLTRVVGQDPTNGALADRLLALAERGLPAMFEPAKSQFVYTRRRVDGAMQNEELSLRYGAIVALGAQHLPEHRQRPLFGGQTAGEWTADRIGEIDDTTNIGDIGLLAWAGAEIGIDTSIALNRVKAWNDHCYTVEAAWMLSALVASRQVTDVEPAVGRARDRLMTLASESGIFPYYTTPSFGPRMRSHVGCFADQVYPIQALAGYAKAYGDTEALGAADRCGQRICELQGEHGQWWWHYDSRSGDVVEGYPVYTVHQTSMAPMCLLDLEEAGGTAQHEAIRRGMSWLTDAFEVQRDMIDDEHAVIWRKVARTDRGKLVRKLRAAATSVRPGQRLKMLDALYRPTWVDEESRPYALGWILYAWLHQI